MKITKKQLRRIIREERGEYVPPSPPGPDPDVEAIEEIASLMANDPEFEMFRKYDVAFVRRAMDGGSIANALEGVLPEYMPGSLISSLVAKVQGDYIPQERIPHPLDGVESDYDTPIGGNIREMKVTKRQLRRIIKEEKAKLKEYGGRPYDPTVSGDYERYRDNPTGDAPIGGISQALIDDYNSWVHKEGHVTPAASSVMASYLIANQMEEDHNAHQVMADFFGLSHEDIMRDIKRQQAERAAMVGEGTSIEQMPDSWRQILGDCLGENK